jgi:serine/threonine protein kinase
MATKKPQEYTNWLPLPPSFEGNQAPSIDLFVYTKILGKGAYGKVIQVKSKISNSAYALKIIKKGHIRNQRLIAQAKSEIELLSKISHPNIVKYFSHFEDKDHVFIIQELAEKAHLYEKLKQSGFFTEKKCASIIYQISKAVRYLHSLDPPIIHRDIKAENILFVDGVAKLADFGWSSIKEQEKARSTFCGTRDYMSPEMVMKRGHDEKVDVWALGILCFELMTGNAPFSSKERKNQYGELLTLGELKYRLEKNILESEPEFPKFVSKESRRLLMRMLEKDVKKRAGMDEIVNDWWFKMNGVAEDEEEIQEKKVKQEEEVMDEQKEKKKKKKKEKRRKKKKKDNQNEDLLDSEEFEIEQVKKIGDDDEAAGKNRRRSNSFVVNAEPKNEVVEDLSASDTYFDTPKKVNYGMTLVPPKLNKNIKDRRMFKKITKKLNFFKKKKKKKGDKEKPPKEIITDLEINDEEDSLQEKAESKLPDDFKQALEQLQDNKKIPQNLKPKKFNVNDPVDLKIKLLSQMTEISQLTSSNRMKDATILDLQYEVKMLKEEQKLQQENRLDQQNPETELKKIEENFKEKLKKFDEKLDEPSETAQKIIDLQKENYSLKEKIYDLELRLDDCQEKLESTETWNLDLMNQVEEYEKGKLKKLAEAVFDHKVSQMLEKVRDMSEVILLGKRKYGEDAKNVEHKGKYLKCLGCLEDQLLTEQLKKLDDQLKKNEQEKIELVKRAEEKFEIEKKIFEEVISNLQKKSIETDQKLLEVELQYQKHKFEKFKVKELTNMCNDKDKTIQDLKNQIFEREGEVKFLSKMIITANRKLEESQDRELQYAINL